MMERGRLPVFHFSPSIPSLLDFVFNEQISRGVDTSFHDGLMIFLLR